MPTLTLETDEILPDTPASLEGEAYGPFPIFWRGKERQFLLRAVELLPQKHVVFACEAGESTGNWVIQRSTSMAVQAWGVERPLEEVPVLFKREYWTLGKLFFLHQPSCELTALLLREDGVGAHLDETFRGTTNFDSRVAPTAVCGTRALITQELNRQTLDTDSPLSFAQHWYGADPQQRQKLVFGEHLSKLRQVLRWALFSESSVWTRRQAWTWKFFLFRREPHQNAGFLVCHRDQPPRTSIDISKSWTEVPLISQVSRFLQEIYIPKITSSAFGKHYEAQRVIERGDGWTAIELETPTAHETLEAALNLRDWLQKHDAPAELLALVGQ